MARGFYLSISCLVPISYSGKLCCLEENGNVANGMIFLGVSPVWTAMCGCGSTVFGGAVQCLIGAVPDGMFGGIVGREMPRPVVRQDGAGSGVMR